MMRLRGSQSKRLSIPLRQFEMAFTARMAIAQHPPNDTIQTHNPANTNKAWAAGLDNLGVLRVHTSIAPATGEIEADFEGAFAPELADDRVRLDSEAHEGRARTWVMTSESDVEHWFNTDVAGPVLEAFTKRPHIWQPGAGRTENRRFKMASVRDDIAKHPENETMQNYDLAMLQVNQNKPPNRGRELYSIDSAFFTRTPNGEKVMLAIGEMKRRILVFEDWQDGDISGSPLQVRLSQELRGYAVKYRCPQVFAFDGHTFGVRQHEWPSLRKWGSAILVRFRNETTCISHLYAQAVGRMA
ncbi:hypothetical protein CDD80_2156 [Ophiocordyceps camponoti-rufipedis]|uniref:Uncharacterized protein n=1 Tax=Ophiocordyceps camponoti-rufipedis TaxID=2004952 RepID=A0A2C5Z1P3_9HYPO|nr:hypothetical protein CDD80_2156 [Ophiocordyceps camponoti-rufipedis]